MIANDLQHSYIQEKVRIHMEIICMSHVCVRVCVFVCMCVCVCVCVFVCVHT